MSGTDDADARTDRAPRAAETGQERVGRAADDATAPESTTSAAPPHGVRWWVAASVVVAFGLLYAYDLFEAVSNLVGVAQLNGLAAEAGVAPVVPWALPVAAVALPPVGYLVAILLGRRHNVGVRALVLLAGLSAVAALTLSITALA